MATPTTNARALSALSPKLHKQSLTALKQKTAALSADFEAFKQQQTRFAKQHEQHRQRLTELQEQLKQKRPLTGEEEAAL